VDGTRLVGGIGPKSTKIAAELFKTVCRKVIETDSTTAEIAKLAENTFRDVNIAFANQLALICERQGVDVRTVINLANTHPRVNIHVPGPGVGGPCLTKDPYFLINSLDLPYDLVKSARAVNLNMSNHMLQLIQQALSDTEKSIHNSRIAILGVAYKNDIDDSRSSPAEPIIRNLIHSGAQVIVYDSWCAESFGADRKNSLEEALEGADCLVVITNHTEFLNLNLKKIKMLMNSKPAIVDGRRIINPNTARQLGFSYFGLGLGAPK
jgi:UDP-N-acetyl-D-mannosaminuronic acid dehydrogenase